MPCPWRERWDHHLKWWRWSSQESCKPRNSSKQRVENERINQFTMNGNLSRFECQTKSDLICRTYVYECVWTRMNTYMNMYEYVWIRIWMEDIEYSKVKVIESNKHFFFLTSFSGILSVQLFSFRPIIIESKFSYQSFATQFSTSVFFN